MTARNKKYVRRLYLWEMDEFQTIFSNSLNYERVRIHECNPWPNRIDRLGKLLQGIRSLRNHSQNAISLGNHCYFSVSLPEKLPSIDDPDFGKVAWLVHEITHVWQFQYMGWSYLWKALIAQVLYKEYAYDFGGEQGLIKNRREDKVFKHFNPEQQGNITQSYYNRKRAGKDVSAWQPFIDDINKS